MSRSVFENPYGFEITRVDCIINLEPFIQLYYHEFQRSVIMLDLLGLDKLASSMALSMCAQAAGILLGPTISGTNLK